MAFITGNPNLNGDGDVATGAGDQAGIGAQPVATTISTPSTAPASASTTTPVPTSLSNAIASAAAIPTDFRARLTPLSPNDVYGSNAGASNVGTVDGLNPTAQLSGSGLMNILNSTNGVIFPYTPTINFSQAVNYTDLQLVHSNTDYPAYTRTPSVTLTVSGKFTVQNQLEGQYALAVIHFFRTVSKSYFGEADAASGKAGLPPPILLFSAYGPYMYNRLRVILKSHSWAYDESMDTIAVNVPAMSGGASASQVRLPALFTIQCELTVVQTPQRMRNTFSFDAFASGQLMNGDGGWI